MKWRILPLILSCVLISAAQAHSASVRSVTIRENNIIPITTALGFSTTVLLPEAAESVILGDQGSFKIEFFKEHLAIKPLAAGVTSNLTVITPHDRFHFLIRVGTASNVDYLVKLERAEAQAKTLSLSVSKNGVTLNVDQLAYDAEGKWLSIRYSLANARTAPVKIKAKEISLRQNKKIIPVDVLYVERERLRPNQSSAGFLRLKSFSFQKSRPLFLSIRVENLEDITLQIPEQE